MDPKMLIPVIIGLAVILSWPWWRRTRRVPPPPTPGPNTNLMMGRPDPSIESEELKKAYDLKKA